MKNLAEFFGVDYKNGSVENTLSTIKLINEKFKRKVDCVDGEKLSDLVLPTEILDGIYASQKANPNEIFEPIFRNPKYAPRGFFCGEGQVFYKKILSRQKN